MTLWRNLKLIFSANHLDDLIALIKPPFSYHTMSLFLFVQLKLKWAAHDKVLYVHLLCQLLNKCDVVCDLLPFLRFWKPEKHPWRSVTFSKIATLLKVTLLDGCFSLFLIYLRLEFWIAWRNALFNWFALVNRFDLYRKQELTYSFEIIL